MPKSVINIKADSIIIHSTIKKILNNKIKFKNSSNPYYKKNTTKQIINVIRNYKEYI